MLVVMVAGVGVGVKMVFMAGSGVPGARPGGVSRIG